MKHAIKERVNAFRAILKRHHINAFIIPSTDPHLSEYVAPHWKTREWISGFSGSAGTVVVLQDQAGLWTDSRYFLQAEEQLEGTDIKLYKEMLPETPTISEFLCMNLHPGDKLGIDGKMFSVNQVEQIQKDLESSGIQIELLDDPIGEIWSDRPQIPEEAAFVYKIEYAGRSCADKINAIRQELKKRKSDSIFITALDEIAWTLNLRGNDVHCNPVVISYLLITQSHAVCFISDNKVTNEVKEHLESQHIEIKSYQDVEIFLNNFTQGSIQIDPAKTNYAIYSAIHPSNKIIRTTSPIALLKAIRNSQEIAGIHEAMKQDGIALVNFLRWLEEAVTKGEETELSIDEKLTEFRSKRPLYKGKSFDTIAGYKEHAAIVHYSATPESNVKLAPKGFLLLDSGAQYLNGTTDITRTIGLGELTEEEKTDYTLVLKGHIALAMAKFPLGTRGVQLDVLARAALWNGGMNFLHGTGHGVGHFLCVHEGPQSIRMNENPVILMPGMVTSNEPGIYKGGKHGIRIENLTLVSHYMEGMYGEYLQFETITLCPICKKGIIKEMLSDGEIKWLNDYHQTVFETLSPELEEKEKAWLKEATASI